MLPQWVVYQCIIQTVTEQKKLQLIRPVFSFWLGICKNTRMHRCTHVETHWRSSSCHINLYCRWCACVCACVFWGIGGCSSRKLGNRYSIKFWLLGVCLTQPSLYKETIFRNKRNKRSYGLCMFPQLTATMVRSRLVPSPIEQFTFTTQQHDK